MKNRRIFSALFIIVTLLVVFWGCQQNPEEPPAFLQVWVIDTIYAQPDPLIAEQLNRIYAKIVNDKDEAMSSDGVVNFYGYSGGTQIWHESARPGEQGIAGAELNLIGVNIAEDSVVTITVKVQGREEYTKNKNFNVKMMGYSTPELILLTLTDTATVGSGDTAWIRAEVQDSAGALVPGVDIEVRRLFGNAILTDNHVITDGTTKLAYIGAMEPGVPDTTAIRAYLTDAPTIDDTIIVIFDYPRATRIILTADPMSVPATGRDTIALTADVDVGLSYEPAPDGMAIQFRAEHGLLLGSYMRKAPTGMFQETVSSTRGDAITVYTHDGLAYAFLVSDTSAGNVCVDAEDTSSGITDTIYVKFIPGEPAFIALTVFDTILTANGIDTTSVRASVYDEYYNPVEAGDTIAFNTYLGSINPQLSPTDHSGQAWAVLQSGIISGHTTVGASHGSAQDFASVWFTSSTPQSIALSVNPSPITADGIDSSIITAYVTDENSMPVSDDTEISFICDRGRLVQYSLARISADTLIARTENGYARTKLVSDTLAAPITVVAMGYDELHFLAAADTVQVELNPGNPYHIDVTFSRDTIWANGEDTAQVFAIVADRYHNLVEFGTAVIFDSDMGTLLVATDATDDTGMARGVIRGSTVQGLATVTASSGAAIGDGGIFFQGTIPVYMQLLAASLTMPADGLSLDSLSALVWDAEHEPVSDGTKVKFYAGKGHFLESFALSTTMTDSFEVTTTSGMASIYLQSGTVAGWDTVVAVAQHSEGSVADTLLIDLTPGSAYSITIWAEEDTILADSFSTTNLHAQVFDQYGNHLRAGTSVSFETTLGELVSSSALTDSMGIANAILRSGRTAGTAYITVHVGTTVENVTTVVLIPSDVNQIILSAEPDSATVGGLITLSAAAFDSFGLPVSDGILVEFVAGVSDISPPTVPTLDGVATTSLTAGEIAGYDTVIARVGAFAADTIKIHILPGSPATIDLTASSDTIFADGYSTSDIETHVFDAYGNHVRAGIVVSFSTTDGTIVTSTPTDSMGIATAILRSSTNIGTAYFTARIGVSIEKTIPIEFIGSEAAWISLESADTVSVGNSIELSASVYDSSDFPISDNTRVDFISILGSVVPPTAFTSGGIATATLTAGIVAGYDTVTASVGAIIADTTHIRVLPGEPASIVLGANPDTIISDGYATSDINAQLFDSYGNHLLSGTTVGFSTTMGELVTEAAITDSTGTASVILRSATITGTGYVTASVGGIVENTISVEFISSQADTMFLSLSADTAIVGGTVILTATVYDSIFHPVSDGTPVDFTTTTSDIEPPRAFTTDGVATATLTAGNVAGYDTVTAAVGGLVSDSKILQILPGPVAVVVVAVTPDSLPADGHSNADAEAQLFDAYWNPLRAGRSVSFSANLGTVLPAITLTDSTGTARTHYTAGENAGLDILTATSSSIMGQAEIVLYGSQPYLVILGADNMSMRIDDATPIQLTASVFDSSLSPVTDGTGVTFTSALGGIVPPAAATFAGVAQAELTPESQVGKDTVIAISGSATDTLLIDFQAGQCTEVILSAEPDSIAADGFSRSTITGQCFDAYGNSLPRGVEVGLSTSLGSIISPVFTNDTGAVTTQLTSSPNLGVATITATCEGGVGMTEVWFIPSEVAFIMLSVDPAQVIAGGNIATVQADVRDISGNPVADGTVVSFNCLDTTGSPIAEIDTIGTTEAGIAVATLVSPITIGLAWVYASAMGHADSAMVEFIPGEIHILTLDAEPDSIPADGTTRSTLTARGWDEFDNPVRSGNRIDFATDLGTLIYDHSFTNDTGMAQVPLESARETGTAHITASAAETEANAEVAFTSLDAAMVIVTADDIELPADGISTTIVRATALDSSGAAVPNGAPIFFSTDLGLVVPGVAYTSGGEAYVTLRAPTTPGTATIIASAGGGVQGSTYVDFVSGNPAQILMDITPDVLPADGETTATIAGTVYDANDNHVNGGLVVNFGTSLGSVDTSTYTDTLGAFIATFYAGITPGTAVILADCQGAVAQTMVDLLPTNVGVIYVDVDTNELVADARNEAQITGRVMNTLGMPISDGTPVHLEVHCSDTLGCDGFGEVVPITAHTDSSWFYATFLTGTRIGRIWIVASVDTIIDSARVDLIPGAADSMDLVANPTSIPADSFSISQISATLYDRFGNRLGSHIEVDFSSTLGEIFPTTTTTNSSGTAVVSLRSGRESGVARVRAESGSAITETEVVFTQTEPALVIVRVEPGQVVADGVSASLVSADVSDTLGNPISDGTPVMFAQIVDTAAGEDTLGLLMPLIGFTEGGNAAVQFRAGMQTGRATIRACVDSTHCGDGFVDLIAGQADSIYLVSADTDLPADGMSITDVTASIFDRYGNAVESGRDVSMSTTLGQIYPTSGPTNSSGMFTSILTADVTPGLARITAQCDDAYATVDVNFGMTPPVYLTVHANPSRLPGDGISTSTVTAHMINATGGPVMDGTMIIFHSLDMGGSPFGDIDTIATTLSGDAIVTLIAATVTGTAYVSATYYGANDTLTDTTLVIFQPGEPSAVRVTATPGTLYANDTLTARVTVTIIDEFGNMVNPGHTVSIEASTGEVFPTTGYTGDTIICLYYPGSEAGRAVITATCDGISGITVVELLSQTITEIAMYADSAFLTANGLSTTPVHVVAQDAMGHPVADGTPLFFTTTAGVVFPGVVYTSGGEATATLRSGTVAPDTAMVIVTAGTIADTLVLPFVPGRPALINVVTARNILWADGDDTTMVRAYITDIHGNWISVGKVVSFTANLGMMVDTFDVTHALGDTTGYAEAMFRAGIDAGAALITVTCGDAVGTGRITLDPTNVGEVAIFADPDIITADGHMTADIHGYVRNTLGNPIAEGTQVRMGVFPDSLGNISPATAYTDSGNFSAVFTASTIIGSVWVWMEVSGVRDSVVIELIPGNAHTISMTPMIGMIPADSATVDTIAVVVYDRYGNCVRGGVSVEFTTSLGEAFPLINETNSSGSTYVFLRSGYQTGVARVVARVDSARGECSIVITNTAAATVYLTVEPHTIMADGFSTTELTAIVLDSMGHPISDGTPVVFTVNDTNFGMIIPGIAYTVSGEAYSTFRAAVQKGHPVLRAATDTMHYDEVTITLTAGNPAEIILTANPDTLSANGMDQSDIRAVVYDEWGNAVDAGRTVAFNSILGTILFASLFTDDAGVARTVLKAGSVPGNCQVSAQCGGVYDVIDVTFLRSSINTIILSADPPELTVDGISSSAIVAQAFDNNGSPVTDNTKIYYWVTPVDTAGTVISPRFTSGGSAATSYRVGTDVGNGYAWIYAADTLPPGNTVTDSVRITLRPGDPAYIVVWMNSSHVPPGTLYADGNDGEWIYAQVFDAYGNHVLGGNTVSFQTTMGDFTPAISMTDTSGISRAFLQSGLIVGNSTITITCISAMGFLGVEMVETGIEGVLLIADQTVLTADGIDMATVTATVFAPGGTPVSDGAIVHFFAESSWVHLLPENTYTDSGEASSIVRADTIARSSVRIYAYATIGSDTSDTASLNFRIEPGPPARMVISPMPSDSARIPADGASGVQIEAWIYDQYSNPIRAGSTVRFATTLGIITEATFSDMSGYAAGLLTAGTEVGNAVITITCNDIAGNTQVNFYELTTYDLVMTITPPLLTADGMSEATITVHAFDSAGFPASDGSRIEFDQLPNGGGFVQGVIMPHIAYTVDGVVSATLIAPLHVGDGRIYAYADTVGSAVVDSFGVRYIPGPAAIIVFDTTGFGNFMADGRFYSVPVRTYDAYGNPVGLGTNIDFNTTLGSIESPAVVNTDSGDAVTYASSHETGPAVITARSGDAVATASCNFTEIEGNWISIIANPYMITADGASQSLITATLMDTSSGMFIPVSDGVPVQFQVNGPGILSASVSFTSSGQASVYLTAGTYADTSTVYAIGPITAMGDTLRDSVKVYLSPGPPAIVEFISSYLHDLPANGADTMQVWVKIMDAFGNGVVRGTPVSFGINMGTITPNSATNDSGHAWAIVTASSSPGVATISSSCQSAVGYATIAMQQLVADSIILAVYPREIVADGASTSELTAVVFDSTGLPVSDGTIVRFSASRGITRPSIAYTTDGVAMSELIASVSPDTVIIAAISGTVSDTGIVILIPGPPARMTVCATPDSTLIANGNDSLRIWVHILDDYGNAVREGQPVNFSSTLGIITPNSYTNAAGSTSVILSSEYEVGWSQVQATCGDASASMLIQFSPDNIGRIILSVNPITLTADGTSSATVTVTVLDSSDHPIADGTPVLFSGLSLGLVDPPVVTTVGGSGNATMHSFTIIGIDTIIASSGGATDSVVLTFEAGPPANVILVPDTNFLISDGADTTTVIATVTDAAGNPVANGTVVYFNVEPSDMGAVLTIAVTSDSGRCATLFQAGTQPGIVAVHGQSGSANGTCVIELVPPLIESIVLSVADHYLAGDGISSTQVIAMVFDTLGLPAPNGTGVSFDITAGSVPANLFPAWAQTTDGIATVQLIAPTDIGVCSVFAYIDTIVSDTEVVYFEGGDPQVILFNPTTLTLPADGATVASCTLIVLDRYGNPIGARPVNMALDLGSISPDVVVTDTAGHGVFTVVSSRNIGDGVISAVASPAEGYMNVHYQAVPVDTILLFATPSILPADGSSQSTITAVVLDSLGRLASNGIGVFFFTNEGYITPYDTTADGQAQAVLTAIDTAQLVVVTAVSAPCTSTVQVQFTAGVPDTVLVFFSQGMDTVGSGSIDSIYGQILDTLGNPVGEGSLVELWLAMDGSGLDTCGGLGEPCSLGTIGDVTILTDSEGRFSTDFTPGTKSGIVWIHGKCSNAMGRDYMILRSEVAHTESLDVNRNHIYVRGTGGIDQAVITAHIFDRYNNPVKDSTKVVFWCTNYPGGTDTLRQPSLEPADQSGNQLWSDTIYTLSGRANVTLRSGKASGVVIVRSEILDGSGITSEAPRVTIASGLPYYMSVSRSDCNVPGWLVDGLRDTIMVYVSDSMENPCPNMAVYFTTEEGIVTGAATTDSTGFALATWFSADPRDDGVVYVEARTRGDSSASCHGEDGWVCDSVWFYNSGPAASIILSESPSAINADGLRTSEISIQLTDVNGNPPVDETEIRLDTDIGSITTPVMSYNECYGSRGDATYTGAVVDVDDDCATSRVATATINGEADFAFGSTTVDLMGGNCSSDKSTINAPGNVPMGGVFAVAVTVKDIWGNPICNEGVDLISALGVAITGTPGTTNDVGNVSFGVTALTDSVDRTDLLTATFGECIVYAEVAYKASKGLMRTAGGNEAFEPRIFEAVTSDSAIIRERE